MTSRALFYHFRNGDALDETALNRRFVDLDRRMVAIEGLEIDYRAMIAAVQNMAVERLDSAVRPLIKQVQDDAAHLQTLIENAGELVTRPALEAALADPAALDIHYDAEGRVIGVEVRLPDGTSRTTELVYDAAGVLSRTATTTPKGQRTVHYRYTDGLLSGYAAQEVTNHE